MSWLKEMFSGESGEVSSKRTVLFLFVFTFISLAVASQVTQKTFDATMKDQLFWLLQTTLILVFGERALAAWEAVSSRTKKDKTETKTNETNEVTKNG